MSRGGPSVRVEFVGLPGAGKTHCCREAQSALRSRGIEARLDFVEQWRSQRRRTALDALVVALRRERGIGVAAGVAWLRRHAPEGSAVPDGPAWRAFAYLLAVDAHVRRLGPAPVWLHDQGTVQALWSLAMRSAVDAASVAAAFGWRVAWPDVVVEVRAPLETVLERLARREALPSSLRDADGDAGLRPALERGSAALSALRQRACPDSTWRVLPEGSDAGDEVARLVASRLDGD